MQQLSIFFLFIGRLYSISGPDGAQQQVWIADGRVGCIPRPTAGGSPGADPARNPQGAQNQRSV